ncbi:hypothetical protein D8674_005175 [Pyrus ussuriensis x Pyrus communis]|uniref:F-box domain-containing protein n=1 Tax=Pyrus ussuriensis x Pyrus communis TaxID=2448454 RepID=A0A5N5FQQ1_9ROSA|nr:hypothetical protein D8674_005175 [Pyrus ussuriensis x Pyrus communis]
MSNYYFPEAILREILLRLPIKSLGKCSAVCLSWRSLIQTSAFIHAHLSCAVQSSNQNDTDHLFLRNALAEKEDATHQVGELFSLHWDNPAFGFMFLPRPRIAFSATDYTNLIATYAFGYDLRIDDYKVLRIVSNKNVKARCKDEVWLLAGGHWKSLSADVIPADFMPAGIAGRYTQAFVNGSPHWLQPSKNEGNCIYEISDGSNTITRVHMWIMKEYGVAESWTKLLSACLEGSLTGPFGVRKSGEVVFRILGGVLVLVDPETEQVKDFETDGYRYFFMDSFVESLVLLDQPNAISY